MNHDVGARAALGAVVGIGVANIEREVIFAAGIERLRRDGLESLRRLAIPLGYFGPQCSAHSSNGVGL